MESLTRHLILGSFLCAYLHLITENSILISLKQYRVLISSQKKADKTGFRNGLISDLFVLDYSRFYVLRGFTLPSGLVLLTGLRREKWRLASQLLSTHPTIWIQVWASDTLKPQDFQWLEGFLASFCGQGDSSPDWSRLWLSSLITMRRKGSPNWWWIGLILGTRDEGEGKLFTVANMYWAIQTRPAKL